MFLNPMILTTKAIVLSSFKYDDSSLIVKCFTLSSGIKSYMLKGVLTSKRGKLRKAYFQPLTVLEIVAVHKNKGTLERINEVTVVNPFISLHNDIYKNAISIFLSEVLTTSLYEEEENRALFNYLEYAFQWLDTHHEIANFHIAFLLGLTKYLGFYPDDTNANDPYFDLREGVFTKTQPHTAYLQGDELNHFKHMMGIIFDDIPLIKMNHIQRRDLLNTVISYFELHLQGFKKPKSLQVLSQVFE